MVFYHSSVHTFSSFCAPFARAAHRTPQNEEKREAKMRKQKREDDGTEAIRQYNRQQKRRKVK